MATVNQHPNVCYVTAPIGQPNYVVIQTQPQSQEPQRLYLRKTHKVLGILQMIAGCLCFLMEVIGVCAGPNWELHFTGFYTGVFFTISGLFGYLASKKNNNCFLVTCMVLSIIAASIFCTVGIFMSHLEMYNFSSYYSSTIRLVQNVKEWMIIAACAFEFVVSIIQASCSCASCCKCCWPIKRQPPPVSGGIPATVIVQQPNQMDASIPLVTEERNAPTPVSTKPPSYPQSGQQNEAFSASNMFGASSDSPPPYHE